MKISNIVEILGNSEIMSNSVDVNNYTSNVESEHFSAEGEEITIKFNGSEYTIYFDLECRWNCVNSGGDGWENEDYDYPENIRITDIIFSSMYDSEGEEIEIGNSDLGKIQNYIESLCYGFTSI